MPFGLWIVVAATAFYAVSRFISHLRHPLRKFPGPLSCVLSNIPYASHFSVAVDPRWVEKLHAKYVCGPVAANSGRTTAGPVGTRTALGAVVVVETGEVERAASPSPNNVAEDAKISLSNLITWNPWVGTNCDKGLFAGLTGTQDRAVCIGVNSTATTPVATGTIAIRTSGPTSSVRPSSTSFTRTIAASSATTTVSGPPAPT
ncbi:hypothetical protein QBC43DRAFT_373703 [Cladorrhinum sp. PSN259]|nr:hypothetical protein QBC43DRAFT_373703 [Cladorrhinum sp. PSN259]